MNDESGLGGGYASGRDPERASEHAPGRAPGHAPGRQTSTLVASPHITDDDLAGFLDLPTELCGVFDPEAGVLWCNQAAREALGRSVEDLSGTGPNEFLHPDDLRSVAELGAKLVSGDEVTGIETRFLSQDGTWRWLEWTARRDVETGLIFGVARDITAARIERDALRSNERQLQAIVDNSASAIFVKDRQCRYVLVNDAFLTPIGLTVHDVLGKTVSEIWPDAGEAVDVERDARMLEQGDIEASDDQVELADGMHTYMSVRFPLRDGSGRIVGFAGITTDITERTRIEEALDERQRLLDTIVRASPDIVTILDRTGHVTDISEASRTILGLDAENPVHDEVAALVHPDDLSGIYNDYGKLLTLQATRLDIRYRVKHSDGHWVTLDSRGQAIVEDDGTSGGIVVISRDVTAELEFEQQLTAAVGIAEDASEAKSDFLSRMSHELRTPLNSVLGFAQLLDMDELPPEQAEAVGHILRAGRHLLNLIDEVLDIARIESGRLDLSVEPVALASVLHDAVNLAGPLAEERHVEITLDLVPCPHDAHVLADRQRLLQVMLNLLSNGVKYNSNGGHVQVSVRASTRRSHHHRRDRYRPRHCSRRHWSTCSNRSTASAQSSPVSKGRGWDSRCRNTWSRRWAGPSTLQSEVEVGSTFTVELPNAEAPDAPRRHRRIGRPHRLRWHHPGPAHRGQPRQSRARRAGLVPAPAGRAPRPPCTGVSVSISPGSITPTSILLDLHLPDMSGVDVLDELRRDPATKDTPVVIVSADATATQIRRLHGKGATAYLTKPIDIRELIRVVELVSSSIKATP